jgi:glycosyltransferase involved in cell wall biosynthesis
MDTPDSISVIITTYNYERYLVEAIRSVLTQSHLPQEVIVVDDGSTDGTAITAQRFGERVRYDYQPNGGIGAARNRGLALARGQFLAFLDADDLWLPDKLERQFAAFVVEPDLDMVSGYVQQFVSPELDAEQKARLICPTEPSPGYLPGALLIRRQVFDCVGPFRTDLRVGEFIDWHARATELGLTSRMLADVVLKRRLHTTNQSLSHGAARPQADFLRVLKGALDRRRK